jgi:hypothetical protein
MIDPLAVVSAQGKPVAAELLITCDRTTTDTVRKQFLKKKPRRPA